MCSSSFQPWMRIFPFLETGIHELVAPLPHSIEDGEVSVRLRQAQASPGDELVVVPPACVDVVANDAHLLA